MEFHNTYDVGPAPSLHAGEIWKRVLTYLSSRNEGYLVGQLRHFKPMSLDGRAITLGIDDPFFGDQVENHSGEVIRQALHAVIGAETQVNYETVPRTAETMTSAVLPSNQRVRLNEKFTFESYVVSESNQLPAAAAHAVASAPGRAYNPLFIYGSTGLGKTHLLHAIGNRIRHLQPNARALYFSSEEYTNQYIKSVSDKSMPEFRRRFREECDVLLIDDIQFLGGKEQTQTEFFHTFNALHQMGKAVVMTSDTAPSDITGLEQRLTSRFAMGLIADVHGPSFEARVAILKKKAERDGIQLPDDVAQFIARSVASNVRELEGALIRVVAMHTLTGQELNVELCVAVLHDIIPAERAIDTDQIQREVAKHFKVTVDDLRGERRVRNVARARHIAMYLCRTLTPASLPEIGKKFNKDHSTVLTSVRKIERRREDDDQLKLDLRDLGTKLNSA